MGVRSAFSNFVYKQAQKRGLFDDVYSQAIRYRGIFADDDNVMSSSDVYELIQDISNQIAMANWYVEDKRTKKKMEQHWAIDILQQPNNYLTGTEFLKLMTNLYLIHGEIFPILDGRQMHICDNVQTELDDRLVMHFKINGSEIPSGMIRQIKNIGTNHLEGKGLLELGKSTLDGVLNAEKVLTDKYRKGGLLAFLLKLEAHISPQNLVQSKLINTILDKLEEIDDSRTVKLIPLGKGYSIDTLDSPIDDEKILAYLNVYKKDLGKYLGINVETYQALIKADLEKAMMYLHNKAVRPILKNYEDHLSLLFFGRNSNMRLRSKIEILDFVTYSTKTNIAYNIVRTGITSPDTVADRFLGLPTQDTPESQAIYISNDLSKIGEKKATDDSLKASKGGETDGITR